MFIESVRCVHVCAYVCINAEISNVVNCKIQCHNPQTTVTPNWYYFTSAHALRVRISAPPSLIRFRILHILFQKMIFARDGDTSIIIEKFNFTWIFQYSIWNVSPVLVHQWCAFLHTISNLVSAINSSKKCVALTKMYQFESRLREWETVRLTSNSIRLKIEWNTLGALWTVMGVSRIVWPLIFYCLLFTRKSSCSKSLLLLLLFGSWMPVFFYPQAMNGIPMNFSCFPHILFFFFIVKIRLFSIQYFFS